jgi:hypothetical protein
LASDVKKLILKYGKETAYTAGGRTTAATVRCDGCGKEIKSGDDLSDVCFSLTKRKTCIFWHKKCTDKVWSNKIKDNKK